ncbi:patatin-like phospholipase family protein [Kangiella sp. TOML190]|uniref:patatin-like phospholipase family protein n=1 Tax=Kangiella sp. TOML190 TaxID=2931351 RepID=UPI00203A79A8|nr:patatin-like phospholipase family protein [Kangiella sp. TOML190]
MSKKITLLDWLKQEPFSLTLSSGFFGFFAHTGVLTVLEEEGLTPQRVLGASSGALAGACWAAGINSIDLRTILFALKRQDFWDPGFGWGLLKGEKFRQKLAEILPVNRFEDCPIPLALSAYDLKK